MYPFTSLTRLNAYRRCAEFYRLKYVEKLKAAEAFEPALVVGRLAHKVLEEILDPNTDSKNACEVFSFLLEAWVKEYGLESLCLEKLITTVIGIGELLYKASSRYCGKDAIRNQNGSVPSNVFEYPPHSWTKAMKDSDLSKVRFALDNQAAQCNPVFVKHSLTNLLAETYSYVHNFQPPEWVKTIGVEMGISTTDMNTVLFPGESNLYARAYLDWVVEIEDEVFVLDHKSEDLKPSPIDVLHHAQLNFNAYLYEKVYGIRPRGIGIHHLPSGEIILAELDLEIQTQTVEYLQTIQKQIKDANFWKKHPGDPNSPCVRKNWKTKNVESTCPYLERCWGTYSQLIVNC